MMLTRPASRSACAAPATTGRVGRACTGCATKCAVCSPATCVGVFCYDLDSSGSIVIRERGSSIAPSNIRVLYNRECVATYDDGTPCAPPHVYLMHEMQHVMHAMSGEIANHIPDSSDPMPGGSNHEGAGTICRGTYLATERTENAVRREVGLPVRDSHGSLCGPRP